MSAIGSASARSGAIARSPASTSSLACAMNAITIGVPCSGSGMNGHRRRRSSRCRSSRARSGARRASAMKPSIDLGGRRQEQHAAHDPRERPHAEAEPGGDAEVAAAAADRPEQVGVVSASVRTSSPSAVTTSAASRLSIVRPCARTRNPMPPPSVMPPIPTEPVSPNPVATPRSPAIDGVVARRQAGLGPGGPLVGVDLQRGHVAQVEHDPAVDRGVPGAAVPAAADGQLRPGLARVRHDPADVVVVRHAGDRGGARVDARR